MSAFVPKRGAPPPGPPDLPPGVQPEEDGRLQCRECGNWYRQLGQHVVFAHDISTDDYRRRYELPASRGLHASDILERRSERGKAMYEADPEGYRRDRLTPHSPLEERLALSRAARAESMNRAGVEAAALASGAQAGAASRRASDARFHRRAVELGYGRVEELLAAQAELSNTQLAKLLKASQVAVALLRERHGFEPPGRWPEGYVPTSAAHRPRMSADELADIPRGVQPTRAEEAVCRDCGQWVRAKGLPQHLAAAHSATVTQYQRRHGLEAHQMRAEELGHTCVEDFLQAHVELPAADLAAMLQVAEPVARALRARYHLPIAGGPARRSAADLADLAPGVQPEQFGKLLCRECGGWYRGLSQHLPHKHGISPEDYRERHGLAVGACLQAEELHERKVEIGRRRREENPEWFARFRAGGTTTADPAQAAAAAAGRRESASRPGGRAHYLEAGHRISRVIPDRIRAEFADRSAALGYPSVEAMLTATADLSGADVARLLNVAAHRVYYLRQVHGYDSPGRHRAADAPESPRTSLPSDRALTCLECGGGYQHLGKHVSIAHGLKPTEYRDRHGLAPNTPLHTHR